MTINDDEQNLRNQLDLANAEAAALRAKGEKLQQQLDALKQSHPRTHDTTEVQRRHEDRAQRRADERASSRNSLQRQIASKFGELLDHIESQITEARGQLDTDLDSVLQLPQQLAAEVKKRVDELEPMIRQVHHLENIEHRQREIEEG